MIVVDGSAGDDVGLLLGFVDRSFDEAGIELAGATLGLLPSQKVKSLCVSSQTRKVQG